MWRNFLGSPAAALYPKDMALLKAVVAASRPLAMFFL
ncbi:hypothetical protein ACFX13_035349 [Malus domestica]